MPQNRLNIQLPVCGKLKVGSSPLKISLVWDHATIFWFSGEKDDYRDALPHIMFLLGLKLGRQYDEVQKIEIRHVTGHFSISVTGSIVLTIMQTIKDTVNARESMLRQWTENNKLRSSLIGFLLSPLLS